MVAASLASLRLAGCFVEVGKRDIWSRERMAQERPDIAYHLIAIDFLAPPAIHASMQRISLLLASGESLQLVCLLASWADRKCCKRAKMLGL